ncbi:peptide-methionine (S)-S-oxide reductase MsrA [Paenibacillus kandeliae]|uniref:peptide-methionine (S)-S-oxide reductase MsrA n=1 Tax=Paenibacillus kandeliae TaxID=3231269 RepID=UPI003458FE07
MNYDAQSNPKDDISIQRITLGLGCFWGPESWLGALKGVVHTSTGYAGGTTEQPVYRQMGDHSETIRLEYNPDVLPLETLLTLFWEHHRPEVINTYKDSRQYRSILLYEHEDQRNIIQRLQAEHESRAYTEIQPCSTFYLAEERHQKYYLQRKPEVLAALDSLFTNREQALQSTLAARLNGWSREAITVADLLAELEHWQEPLNEQQQEQYRALLLSLT